MKRVLFLLTASLACLLALFPSPVAAAVAPGPPAAPGRVTPTGPPSPPGQPRVGYGSTQKYICSGYTMLQQGCTWLGTGVTCFVPDRLKNGTKAPLVIFLHGFKIVWPDFYLDFIKHLTNQGYVVIYPCANVGSLLGSFLETDQNVFMQRALDNTAKGLAMVAGKADLSNITVFGHSLGALLASCWIGSGGIHPKAVVLANVSTDPSQGIPDFVKQFIHITPIDWRTKVKAVDVPVIMLTGDHDTLAPSQQSRDMFDYLVNARSRVLYCLRADDHGVPSLSADHNASLSSSWFIPGWLMNQFFGGDGEVDATDYRCYWAALDAALDGKTALRFRMGNWSDGVPVKPVLELAP